MLKVYPKKLEEKLSDFEKGYLKAIDDLLNGDLETYFNNYILDVDTGAKTMDNLKEEVAQEIYSHVETALISLRNEVQVSFIESNG